MSEHKCFSCDEANPLRIVTRADEGWTFRFVDRFVGPRGRAHGGTAVGAMTCPALQLAEQQGMKDPVTLNVRGRLSFPVPLAEPIKVGVKHAEGRYNVDLQKGSFTFLSGFVEVADIKTEPGSVLQDPPPERRNDLRELAELADAGLEGPTVLTQTLEKRKVAGIPWDPPPICFGCSETETALKLRHRIPKPGCLWTRWETEPTFTDGNGRLATTMAVAVLDCSTLWVIGTNEPDLGVGLALENKMWMTGTYGVRFLRVPPMDVEGGYRVATRYLGRDGRKSFTMSALLDREGTVYAMAEAISILIDLPEGYVP